MMNRMRIAVPLRITGLVAVAAVAAAAAWGTPAPSSAPGSPSSSAAPPPPACDADAVTERGAEGPRRVAEQDDHHDSDDHLSLVARDGRRDPAQVGDRVPYRAAHLHLSNRIGIGSPWIQFGPRPNKLSAEASHSSRA